MSDRALLLLRHAKSSRDDPALDDFDRPLAERGCEAAARVGREIARRRWLPEMAIVSPALRTRQTWELVSAEWPGAVDAVFDGTLYEAAASDVLEAIHGAPDRVSTLLVVGHNPGMADLAGMLAGPRSDPAPLAGMTAKFPTAALACFRVGTAWRDLGRGGAVLAAFTTPRDLG